MMMLSLCGSQQVTLQKPSRRHSVLLQKVRHGHLKYLWKTYSGGEFLRDPLEASKTFYCADRDCKTCGQGYNT